MTKKSKYVVKVSKKSFSSLISIMGLTFLQILFGDEEKITFEKFLANGLEHVKQLLALQKVFYVFYFSSAFFSS